MLILIALIVFTVLIFSFYSKSPSIPVNADKGAILPILYQQRAAEYKALCFQAYNLARLNLDAALGTKNKHLKYAIITDLDETALDNSPFNAGLYLVDTVASSQRFHDWWLSGKARAVPGSVDFFKYAYSKNIDIYYVTGRPADADVLTATRENMSRLGFPYTNPSDTCHFLFQQKSDTSSKEIRRLKIQKDHTVLLLLGDNLTDFAQVFDKQPMDVRDKNVEALRQQWGSQYIVFPNSLYGDWESALYKGFKNPDGSNATMQQKDSIRSSLLQKE